jgi:hypothetical protein
MGDMRLPVNFRYNKSFIIETIKNTFPEITFHFDLKKSDFKNENDYYIIRLINSEIIRRRGDRLYGLRTDDILQKIYDNFLIEREEALDIIKSIFPKIRVTEKRFSIRQPWRDKVTA